MAAFARKKTSLPHLRFVVDPSTACLACLAAPTGLTKRLSVDDFGDPFPCVLPTTWMLSQ